MKIKTSKSGHKFAIVKFNRPAENGVVFFLENEWHWMMRSSLLTEEFDCIYGLKRDNPYYDPIPERTRDLTRELVEKYVPVIQQEIMKSKTYQEILAEREQVRFVDTSENNPHWAEIYEQSQIRLRHWK